MSHDKNILWETRIESVMDFGHYISWGDNSGFVDELSGLLVGLESLAKVQPTEALPLFEIFIAASLTKASEIDDSSGSLGMFMDDLFVAWTRCCVVVDLPVGEFLRKIAHWQKVDDYGLSHDLEKTVIPALSIKYSQALCKSLEEKGAGGDRHAADTIKKILASSKDTQALITFCENSGTDDGDCLALASIFYENKQFDNALDWIEKGLRFGSFRNEYELKKLKRAALCASGRGTEAVSEAWVDFEKSPSFFRLETVLESAPADLHAALKEKALPFFASAEIGDGAVGLHRLGEFELLLSRLKAANVDELQKISYSDAIPMAEALAEYGPQEAARLYIAHALLILIDKRSKAYHHAHNYLAEAKRLLELSSELALWERLVIQVRQEHRLKSSFMPGFERIVAGKGAPREPTFSERIAGKLDPGPHDD